MPRQVLSLTVNPFYTVASTGSLQWLRILGLVVCIVALHMTLTQEKNPIASPNCLYSHSATPIVCLLLRPGKARLLGRATRGLAPNALHVLLLRDRALLLDHGHGDDVLAAEVVAAKQGGEESQVMWQTGNRATYLKLGQLQW